MSRRARANLGWIAAAALSFAGAAALAGWPAWTEWRHGSVRALTQATGHTAMLAGVPVQADGARAMVLAERPDRALVHLRLTLGGDPALRADWIACDLALKDAAGRRWLPLTGQLGDEIIRLLALDGGVGRSCSQSLRPPVTLAGETAAPGPGLSDQAFLVPAAALDDLRLVLSAPPLWPDGVSLPLRIDRRPSP